MKRADKTQGKKKDFAAPCIDPGLPVEARIRRFMETGGDPYRLTLGNTSVSIRFSEECPSLQSCLSQMCERYK